MIPFDKLKEPFEEEEIEWRVQQCGKSKNGKIWALIVPYIQNRAIQNRLDSVVGGTNWTNRFTEVMGGGSGFLCTISIRDTETNEWLDKTDGANLTGIEAIKGGISDSMKRAAVQWGIGRYLYTYDAFWAENIQDGYPDKNARTISIVSKKDNIQGWCYPPKLNGTPKMGESIPPATAPAPAPATDKQLRFIKVLMDTKKFEGDNIKLWESSTNFLSNKDIQTATNASKLVEKLKALPDQPKDKDIKVGVLVDIERLENDHYDAIPHRENGRKKYLEGYPDNGQDLSKYSLAVLNKYAQELNRKNEKIAS